MSLYDDLGVDKSADESAIKSAFRKAAQQHHPDRKNGDVKKFQSIQRAYDILGNAESRARYDETGEDKPQPSVHEQAVMGLANIVLGLIESVADIEHTNLHELLLDNLRQNSAQCADQKKAIEKKIEKREKALKRFKRHDGKESLIGRMIEGDIAIQKQALERHNHALKILAEMKVLADEYFYVADVISAHASKQMENFFSFAQFGGASPWGP